MYNIVIKDHVCSHMQHTERRVPPVTGLPLHVVFAVAASVLQGAVSHGAPGVTPTRPVARKQSVDP